VLRRALAALPHSNSLSASPFLPGSNRKWTGSLTGRLWCSLRHGLRVVLADVDAEKLHTLGREIAAQVGEQNVLVVPTDVSSLEQVQRLKDKAYEAFGEVRTPAAYSAPPAPIPMVCFSRSRLLCWRNFGAIGD